MATVIKTTHLTTGIKTQIIKTVSKQSGMLVEQVNVSNYQPKHWS